MREIREKHDEISEELVGVIREYLDERVVSAYELDGEFFQLMEDIVLPVIEECLSRDILNDKHLAQHLDELEEIEQKSGNLQYSIEQARCFIEEIEELTRRR